jgi:NADH:ubiquinone oxidoreductase subunit F (NADH-binding)
MNGYVMAHAGYSSDVAVISGPRLLAGIGYGPGLAEHRATWQAPMAYDAQDLLSVLRHGQILGRGGAGFPFARKMATALEAGKRRSLVVNASEGEPGSAKDSALMTTAPHLVLDGAEVVAKALGTSKIHVVLPAERPAVEGSVLDAVAERRHGFTYDVFLTAGGFVGGQARAVIELIEGRENLPVTAWVPEAVSGIKGRPTLLSNAETFAQVAALVSLGVPEYASLGTPEEPGTTLLTVAGDGPGGVVIEVPLGIRLADVLERCGYTSDVPMLVGGYHGFWLSPEEIRRRHVLRADLREAGASLGAGVMLPMDPHGCPVVLTARIVEYLAGQSARRCGPCKFGLPALAEAAAALADGGGRSATTRMKEVAGIVTGRGACAHPDGTVRLVRSLVSTFPGEVAAHEQGHCQAAAGVMLR